MWKFWLVSDAVALPSIIVGEIIDVHLLVHLSEVAIQYLGHVNFLAVTSVISAGQGSLLWQDASASHTTGHAPEFDPPPNFARNSTVPYRKLKLRMDTNLRRIFVRCRLKVEAAAFRRLNSSRNHKISVGYTGRWVRCETLRLAVWRTGTVKSTPLRVEAVTCACADQQHVSVPTSSEKRATFL